MLVSLEHVVDRRNRPAFIGVLDKDNGIAFSDVGSDKASDGFGKLWVMSPFVIGDISQAPFELELRCRGETNLHVYNY